MNSLEKLQKLPNNVRDLGKIIVATSFEWLPKVQKIAKSGHTDWFSFFAWMFCGQFLSSKLDGQPKEKYLDFFGLIPIVWDWNLIKFEAT